MNALVMYDLETRTLWSQFLGRGVRGPLAETLLEPIPLTFTTWERWKIEHPDTIALDKRGGFYDRDTYESYYRSERATGVIGQKVKDKRLRNKALVLGVGFDDGPKAYPFAALAEKRIVNDTVAGKPTVIYFDVTADTAFAYERTVDGRELTFSLTSDGERDLLVDNETGTLWIPFTGTAIEGELVGNNLKRVRSTYSFWFAWTDFYPDTELYG